MRVTIVLDIEVDPVTWSQEYGLNTADEAPADVREYVINTVREQLRQTDAQAEVSAR